ncbi:MAG: hypothetical protein B6I24_05910 [Bacteroidetes bacterium 4572_128]|nr:MAG: hypothetical protein B6I24_05910 [Bacteroidetes bacterium 4572_128]
MKIKVLGSGCAKCNHLEKVTRQAVTELKIDANIEKIEDIVKIMGYGVMSTPSLIVNDKILISGYVPSISKMKKLLLK